MGRESAEEGADWEREREGGREGEEGREGVREMLRARKEHSSLEAAMVAISNVPDTQVEHSFHLVLPQRPMAFGVHAGCRVQTHAVTEGILQQQDC